MQLGHVAVHQDAPYDVRVACLQRQAGFDELGDVVEIVSRHGGGERRHLVACVHRALGDLLLDHRVFVASREADAHLRAGAGRAVAHGAGAGVDGGAVGEFFFRSALSPSMRGMLSITSCAPRE